MKMALYYLILFVHCFKPANTASFTNFPHFCSMIIFYFFCFIFSTYSRCKRKKNHLSPNYKLTCVELNSFAFAVKTKLEFINLFLRDMENIYYVYVQSTHYSRYYFNFILYYTNSSITNSLRTGTHFIFHIAVLNLFLKSNINIVISLLFDFTSYSSMIFVSNLYFYSIYNYAWIQVKFLMICLERVSCLNFHNNTCTQHSIFKLQVLPMPEISS